MTGRTYAPAESFALVDVARMIDDDHARNGLECACENQPDGGSWTHDQRTYGEHLTAELAKAGHLRDTDQIANLLNQIARQAGQIEQLTQSLAVATGHRHPFHPLEQK